MGLFDAFESERNDDYHKGSLTHDALGGALAYEVAKAYEDHCAKNNKRPDDHAKAKEVIAGLLGAAVTHLAETKGHDAYDAYQVKQAREQAERRLHEEVGREY